MSKANLTEEDILNLKDWAKQREILKCIEMLRGKNAMVLPNDCCIDFNQIKKIILNEL